MGFEWVGVDLDRFEGFLKGNLWLLPRWRLSCPSGLVWIGSGWSRGPRVGSGRRRGVVGGGCGGWGFGGGFGVGEGGGGVFEVRSLSGEGVGGVLKVF